MNALQVAKWLHSIPTVSDIVPVSVTIKGETFEGAAYKQTPDQCTRLYLLGTLPKCYQRRKSICFPNPKDAKQVFYIAGYFQENKITEHQQFGNNFILSIWDEIAMGSPIDKYEPYEYHRIPIIITEVGNGKKED